MYVVDTLHPLQANLASLSEDAGVHTHTTSLLPMEAGRVQVLHAYDPTKTDSCACFAGYKMFVADTGNC